MKNDTVTILFKLILYFILTIPYTNTDDETVLSSVNTLILNISNGVYQKNDNSDENASSIASAVELILEPSVNIEESVKVAIDFESLEGQSRPNIENDKSDLPNRVSTDDTPVLLSTESSTVELDQLPEISVVITSQSEEISSKKIVVTENDNIPINISINGTETDIIQNNIELEKNETEVKSEDMPSFSEWAQKRLEEVEKNEQVNSTKGHQTTNGKAQNAKLRWKNYASLDCGAKVVAANPEAVSPGAILSPSSDEYKLNPCTSRIWFVVELCEAIQAKKIDLANYELFSSSPKEFTVSVSERFPTRDWALIGKFTAEDERDIQSFDLDTELFGKYIKVEIKSHYGSEHYCPISLFRAYGASVFEVLQKEDAANVNRPDDDDDEDDEENGLNPTQNDKKNLFSSATDAVMSVVKRAAQILGTKTDEQTPNTKNAAAAGALINTCSSPRHVIGCETCNETLFGKIYELLSCKSAEIKRLVGVPSVYDTLTSSSICKKFGYHFKNSTERNHLIKNIEAFFPEHYVGAMCNEAAIVENTGVVNVSQLFRNVTSNIPGDNIVDVADTRDEVIITERATSIDNTENKTWKYFPADEIKPTKTLTVNENVTKTDTPDGNGTKKDTEIADTYTEGVVSDGAFVNDGYMSTESSDVLDDQFISDFTTEGQNQNLVSSSSANSPQAAKESIFLRLFNRIKALERNMSLSSQYLEELSKRYKKQVEEMREETQKRDELNKQLEERLHKLTTAIENMTAERRTFLAIAYCLLFLGFACCCVCFFCGKRSDCSRDIEKSVEAARRKSVDELKTADKEEKKRRPSDQVLKIVRYCSLNEDDRLKRIRKKKKKVRHNRSISLDSIKLKNRWQEEKETTPTPTNKIEEVPVVLDESDNSILDGCKLSKEVDVKSSQIEIESNLTNYTNIISNEPVKKEKKSLKRLLKKVF
ncbi:SUN domain-containing ossification factor [Diorhabda carinulata]|uniref:SUN domain-containing ossification factor n=1 Tax=Diorhabda carinulata TaxID=1163345 RepID=UPI0025A22D63|nr:SUN domain-containing ossification factor [Diorhabda carinulata]